MCRMRELVRIHKNNFYHGVFTVAWHSSSWLTEMDSPRRITQSGRHYSDSLYQSMKPKPRAVNNLSKISQFVSGGLESQGLYFVHTYTSPN